jgi:hypothetical protein
MAVVLVSDASGNAVQTANEIIGKTVRRADSRLIKRNRAGRLGKQAATRRC